MIGELAALRWSAVTLSCGGVGALVYQVLRAPPRPPGALGVRGLKRQRALADPTWGKVEPLVRWLGERLSGALSDGQVAAIDRQLVAAGDYLGLTAPEFVAWTLLSGFAGLAASLSLAQVARVSPVVLIAATGLATGMPAILVSSEATRRQKLISRRLPGAIDLLALAMSAGLDFPGAIRQVVEKASDPFDPLIEELGWIQHKLGLGRTRRQALAEFAVRVPIHTVIEFVGAISQAEERGHPVARVLQVQASQSRQDRSVRAEEAAAKAGVALAFPLILMFISILILIMGPMILRLGHSALFEG
jgi:tight adherence protein C